MREGKSNEIFNVCETDEKNTINQTTLRNQHIIDLTQDVYEEPSIHLTKDESMASEAMKETRPYIGHVIDLTQDESFIDLTSDDDNDGFTYLTKEDFKEHSIDDSFDEFMAYKATEGARANNEYFIDLTQDDNSEYASGAAFLETQRRGNLHLHWVGF
jgi:hypothetical protein